MNLKIIRKEEHNSWDRFVDQTKGGTLFHTNWWHQAWKTHPDIYARKGDSGDFEAGIPIHRSSSHTTICKTRTSLNMIFSSTRINLISDVINSQNNFKVV